MLSFVPLCNLSAVSLAVYQAVLIPLLIMGMDSTLTEEEQLT